VTDSLHDAIPGWLKDLIEALIPVMVFGPEAEERMADPWLSEWLAQFHNSAERIREVIATNEIALEHRPELRNLASKLDEVANAPIAIGSGPDIFAGARDALSLAHELWERVIEPQQTRFASAEVANGIVERASRRLDDLVERGRDLLFTRPEGEFEGKVAEVGVDLLNVGLIHLQRDSPSVAIELIQLGHKLHLVETTTLYCDGGQSIENLVKHVTGLRDSLQAIQQSAFPESTPIHNLDFK
jgi:hypothetical protein